MIKRDVSGEEYYRGSDVEGGGVSEQLCSMNTSIMEPFRVQNVSDIHT